MSTSSAASPRRFRLDALHECLGALLRRLDVPDDHAQLIADILIDTELRGYDDHGVIGVNILAQFYQTGAHNPRPNVRVVRETAGALLLDADRGCGVVAADRAMRWCIEQARANGGMACAAVQNSGWSVVGAPFVEMAAASGLIGFACANSVPLMPAPGGTSRVFGTNPFAYGFPAGRHRPVIFDMASSNVAALKMLVAAQERRAVPEGWITDANGVPTTDPHAFWPSAGFGAGAVGMILPLGYPHAAHKGFGLAMIVDVLAGVLSGGHFGPETNPAPGRAGQFLWALDVEAFMPRDEFLARMDAEIDHMKRGAPQAGVAEVFAPGERGQRRRAELTAGGSVPLSPNVAERLAETCAALGVPLPEGE